MRTRAPDAKSKTVASSSSTPKIVMRMTHDLRPYEKNARVHSPEQIAKVARSITEFGFTNPILVDRNGMVVAGHARLEAAKSLGMTEVPTISLEHLSPAQVRAYMITDNQLALDSVWDEEILGAELAALRDEDFDLGVIGFDEDEIDRLLTDADNVGSPGLTDEDAVPEPCEDATTQPGDLWILGDHRLLCADSTKSENVARLMGDAKAVLMNTDPPYGIDYSKLKDGIPWSGFSNHQEHWGDIENDGLTDGAALQSFLESAIRAAVPHLTENVAFYLWHPMLTQGTFFAAAAAADILIHRQIIWVKPGFVLTRSGMYHWKHELCFYGWIKGQKPPWYGDKSQTSVWECGRDQDSGQHPTQKPVELFVRPILNHSRPNEVVYEPFAGSGSQIIAAQKTQRICYAVEIAPRYVDVCVRRWQDFTGRQAVLEATGQPWSAAEKDVTHAR